MTELTREYLHDHMIEDVGSLADPHEAQTPEEFAERLIDGLLALAREDLEGDERVEAIDLSVPVRLRPVEAAPEGGCVEICVGVGVQICIHRGFKGNRPGPG